MNATPAATDTTLERIKQGRFLIGGEWVTPTDGPYFDVVTPFDETIYARVPFARERDIDAAVTAARLAFDEGPWPRFSPAERADYLVKIADALDARSALLGSIWTHQVGALATHGGFMVAGSTALMRQCAGLASEFRFIERHAPTAGGDAGFLVHEPVGVVGAIIPWNAPILMLASKLSPALLAGCTVVVKTSPEAPLEAVVLGEICQEVGLPPGVVNIVMADRVESELLVRHPGVDKISFTGSSAVGRHVASICGGRMARATLELGGKSAAVLLDDASLDAVVEAVVPQVGSLAMQFCSALTRVVAPRRLHDNLVERLAISLAAIRVGDPLDPNTQMGPMAMRRQLDRGEDFIAGARTDGLSPVTGGGRPAGMNRGFYMEPTLFGGVDNDAKIAREEIFGPVICVIPARDEEHAIEIANDTPFGLNNSVFTQSPEKAMAAARRLRSGTVGHNAFRSDFGIAFGGFKQSGIGREGGREGLRPYLETKTIILDQPPVAEPA